jgi:NAD+ synthase (glutamine-hydrolysing)
LQGNTDKILHCIREAEKQDADILLFPELTISGYPPEDLLLKKRFVTANKSYLQQISAANQRIVTILGFVDNQDGAIQNAGAVLDSGRIAAVYHKMCLPNYSVFDEKRYFSSGRHPLIFEHQGVKFGLNICEDIWESSQITECQCFTGGAEVILSISASPYYVDKRRERLALGMKHARNTRSHLVYLNLVGGQDELVFDGNSLLIDHLGKLIAEGKQFEEDFLLVDIDLAAERSFRMADPQFEHDKKTFESPYQDSFVSLSQRAKKSQRNALPMQPVQPLGTTAEIYQALVLGTRDYVRKNGFQKVVIGLSGGIDSALTAAIATHALGAENVIGVLMPSEFTAQTSLDDAYALAKNLGIKTETIAIKLAFGAYLETLQPVFRDLPHDLTEENIQARIRGNILMALSNKFGWMVLTTGNKSETSVGYSTLYGDMAGGFAIIKDVPKTLVYELSRHVNARAGTELIPAAILTKAPTAELRHDQKDQDTLPPYDQLDDILAQYVESDKTLSEMIEAGYPEEVVRRVARMVDVNEYKRRQAAPGIKITQKAFGKDRRMPITNRFT